MLIILLEIGYGPYLRLKGSSQSLDLAGMLLFVAQFLGEAGSVRHRPLRVVLGHLELICLVLNVRLATEHPRADR